MIPLRVRLRGFLCYKDEQEVSFDGASLWMLSGLNGSGKSAIFDAVTYALFGSHRGGNSQHEELINKNANEMLVEFEFLQDQQAYAIKRTLKRKKQGGAHGTQQIFRRVPAHGDGVGGWEAIEGTSQRDGFKEWINHNIGLTYETFTSSVLLLQGQAEKLLNSQAKGRFEVLASIVDLERFQRLHGRADDRRKKQAARVETLRNRLSALPEVQPLDLLQAEAAITAAEEARQQSQQEIERLGKLELQARQCRDWQERLARVQQRQRERQALIDKAECIEKNLTRLRELRLVLPKMRMVLEQRNQIEDCKRQLAELRKRREKIERDLAQHDDKLAKAKQKRQAHEQALDDDRRKLQQVTLELRTTAGQMEKLTEYERLEQDLARVEGELVRLPADPTAEVRTARETHDQLQELAQVRPHLERFANLRQQLSETRTRLYQAETTRQQVEARGKQLRADLEKVREELEEAEIARKAVDDQASQAKARFEDARRDLHDITTLEGTKVCRVCGQPLTPGHLEAEQKRRQRDLADAEKHFKETATRQKSAQAHEQKLRDQVQALEKQVAEARDDFRDQKKEAEQAQKDEERLQGDLARLYAQLPVAFRQRISPGPPADWLATNYPSGDDLNQLRNTVAGLSAAKKRLGEAEEVLQKWSQFKGQESTLRSSLARLRAGLPKDHAAVRLRHDQLTAEEKALQKSVAARQQALRENEDEQNQLGQLRDKTLKELSKAAEEISTKTTSLQHAQDTLSRVSKELPPDWQIPAASVGLTQVNEWAHELKELENQNTEAQAEQLWKARLEVERSAQELAEVEKQLAAFPEEARQDPAAVQAQLQQARQVNRQRDDELSQARQHHRALESRHKERQQVQEELLQAEGQLNHLELLAKLLGRDRLQLHLVRQAERQVVDHANAVLDRLSGGELFLKLCGEAAGEGNAAKALELEAHNRTTGEKPINVAFLSGSQKFRVAVSLALGIGQYASRQHRPIESVIIDEGFGCLDRNARQVMIQELQNLRTQMRCILLVSHQEEFAAAFPDGYHFELQDGTTVARRFQR